VTVVLDSDGTAAQMTGTVTSYDVLLGQVVANITSIVSFGSWSDWSIVFSQSAVAETSATDSQAVTRYNNNRTVSLGELKHFCGTKGPMSVAERVNLLAAQRSHPSRRISSITVDLGYRGFSAGNLTTILGLEIGDAVSVYVDLGSGDPQVLRQTRRIDGISHSVSGTGSHLVTFLLGAEATVNFTVTLKQNASSVTHTLNEAVYTARDGWVEGHISLSATAAGTSNTEIKLTPSGLPSPASSDAGRCSLAFFYKDGSAGQYLGEGHWDGTDLTFYVHSTSTVTPLGQTPNFAIASGDLLDVRFRYRAAG
jgi:hypothetical protein